VIVVVSRRFDCSLNITVGQNLEEFVVEPLSKRRVLSGELNDFLGDDTSPERAAWGNLSWAISSDILNKFFIN
jgi:hypothetical protein